MENIPGKDQGGQGDTGKAGGSFIRCKMKDMCYELDNQYILGREKCILKREYLKKKAEEKIIKKY